MSCPACSAPRPRRTGSPAVWEPASARRRASLAGLLIALVILGILVWRIADSRRSQEEPKGRVLPMFGAAAPAPPGPGG